AQMPMGMASSHGSVVTKSAPASSSSGMQPMTNEQMAAKVAIRVNGAALTELDVRREMVSIFPYAVQHNGFPKDMEPQIRKGAVEMVVFEELLYQEAKRRNVEVTAEKVAKAEATFRKQFPQESGFNQ